MAQKLKSRSPNELRLGTAYATHELEESNSLFQGSHDVCSPCSSRSHPDCGRADGSCLWRPKSLDQSTLPAQASPADAYGSILILGVDERNESSRSEMGARTFTSRAERFSSHRFGRRYIVASRVRFYLEHSEWRACGAHDDNRCRQGRTARSLRNAAARFAVSQTCDCGPGSPEHCDLWNRCRQRHSYCVFAGGKGNHRCR